jgi:hypothetical protein
VDWDNKGDTFHNQWQTYRTRKNRDLFSFASNFALLSRQIGCSTRLVG